MHPILRKEETNAFTSLWYSAVLTWLYIATKGERLVIRER